MSSFPRRVRVPRVRVLLTAVAVTVGTLGLPAAAFAGTGAASTQKSQAWAGYQASQQTFRYVSASWTVPAISCRGIAPRGDPDSYFWAGLGPGSSNSERAGVRELCTGTVAAYVAYIEMNGLYEVQAIDPAPGDKVSASVSFGSGKYRFSLTDSMQRKSFSLRYSCGAFSFGQGTCRRSTAEVIAGIWAPGRSPIADYHKITFRRITITDSRGRRGSFTRNDQWKITRFSEYDGTRLAAYASPLTLGGTQFAATWRHP
jgi:Peptidase A4 family